MAQSRRRENHGLLNGAASSLISSVDDRLLVLQRILLAMLIASLVFDPSTKLLGLGTFNALLISFGSVAVIMGALTGFRRIRTAYAAFPILAYATTYSVLIPVFSAAVYLLRTTTGTTVHNVYERTYVELFVLLVGVALGVGHAFFLRVTVWALTALAGAVWTIYLLGLGLGPTHFSQFFIRHGLASINSNHFGRFAPSVFYYSSPLLVLAGAYWLYAIGKRPRNVWHSAGAWYALVVTAMLMSGSRTNTALAVCLIVALAWRHWPKRLFAVAAIVAVCILASIATALGYDKLLGPGAINSDSIRFGLFPAYGHQLASPSRLFFGDGLGSCLFSSDRPGCWRVTEFTPLDILRTFGLIGAGLYAALLTLPLNRIRRSNPSLWLAWLLYLVFAIPNAYLFSPMGDVMVALAALAMLEKRRGSDARVDEVNRARTVTSKE